MRHGLNINFKQGKTQLVVNFHESSRSKGKYRAEMQEQHNTFPLPAHASARVVHGVPRYKDHCSIVYSDHRCNADTLARVHSAMSAYSPIAITVFGDPKLPVQVRLLLARSLVFSSPVSRNAGLVSSVVPQEGEHRLDARQAQDCSKAPCEKGSNRALFLGLMTSRGVGLPHCLHLSTELLK